MHKKIDVTMIVMKIGFNLIVFGHSKLLVQFLPHGWARFVTSNLHVIILDLPADL